MFEGQPDTRRLFLNKMLDDFYRDGKIKETRLKELLGHTPIEVIISGVLGYGVAMGLTW